jgi:methylthioxylose transferase
MSTRELALDRPPGISSAAARMPPALLAIGVYGGLIALAYIVGRRLQVSGAHLGLEAPPLFGELEPRIGLGLLAPVLLAVVVVKWGHRVAARIPWRRLLVLATLAAAAWAVALAASDGVGALAAPVANPLDAYAFVPYSGRGAELLRSFTDRIESFPVHVQGHPPGLLLLLKALAAVGWGNAGAAAALYIAGGALVVPAVLVATRSVAGEELARSAAPWLAVAPFALWVATSPDALYAGVAAWGIALIVSAGAGQTARALTGGLLFGFALFLTYGAVALALVPMAVAVARRSFRPALSALAGVAIVAAIFAVLGFWWLDGLLATRERYYAGLGGLRPYWFFVLSNLAALAIACGPAALRGALTRSRVTPAGLLVGAVFVAVVVANLSGLSKGEVERIWLLFTPWLVVAAAWIPSKDARRWLALSAFTAIAVQALVLMPW